jgi:DNA-binding NtrC family response regulator
VADLYDRLRFAESSLPPLRERREGIPLLIGHFVAALHQELPDLGEARVSDAAIRDLVAPITGRGTCGS